MQIAYLIVAHHHYQHLQRLVHALNAPGVSFFLHTDASKPINGEWLAYQNVHLIEPQTVHWGAFSQVEVTLRLMRLAMQKTQPDYLVLLSGVDYPLRSHKDLLTLFSGESAEYINIRPGFQPTKPAERIRKYHFPNINRRKLSPISLAARFIEKVGYGLGLKNNFNLEPFVGSNWFALTGRCVQYILDFVDKNAAYTKAFKYSLCADELFFHTIIGHSPFYQKCKHNLTYADWSVANPPAQIGQRHVEQFKRSPIAEDSYGTFEPFFARKFTNDSKLLLDEIDQHLR